jgi:hypothetical protein
MRGKTKRARRKADRVAGRAETEAFGDFNIVVCAPDCISVQAMKVSVCILPYILMKEMQNLPHLLFYLPMTAMTIGKLD